MRRILIVLASTAVLAGCAAGPDFKRPEPPQAQDYAPQPLPKTTSAAEGIAGAAQTFSPARDIPADWWTVFRSPELNALVEQAIKANPTIEAAQAALRQAQENVYAQQGFFYPTIQAGYSPQRIKLSQNSGSTPPVDQPMIYNWHSAQFTVGFVPDVFGGNRRQVESLQAQADAQRFQFEATYITLASNVVAAAIQEASLRAQIAAARRIIDSNSKALEILKHQLRVGYAARIDVAAQESALAQAEALLPPLQKQFEQTRDLIRVLAGNTPDRDVTEIFEIATLQLPEDLPLSLPSQLVEHRPDIRAAEEQLHAASANVGVAVAARLPQFSINATAGGNAAYFAEMFRDAGKFFTVAGMVSQMLFDGGTLQHRQRAAEEALTQAAAQYRSTVLVAFQNVADTLHALHADADALKAAVRAEQAAKATVDIARKQLEVGYINYLALLSAEQAYQQASMALVQAQATRLGDTAALFQALGGGWWNRKNAELAAAAASEGLTSH